jgi:hypothetical protein
MDNATAEYTFISTFFTSESALPSRETDNPLFSPTALLSPERGVFTERRSNAGSEFGGQRERANSVPSTNGLSLAVANEERASSDTIWKQVLDPVLEYCQVGSAAWVLLINLNNLNDQVFVRSALDPIPPVIPLLTMIRLTEDVVAEVQKRNCPPLESFVFALRLQMWPVFQKAMAEHINSLKKLAEGASSGYFSRTSNTTDGTVSNVSAGSSFPFYAYLGHRYANGTLCCSTLSSL